MSGDDFAARATLAKIRVDDPDTIDSTAGGRRYFEAGLRNTLLSAYYTAAALDTGR